MSSAILLIVVLTILPPGARGNLFSCPQSVADALSATRLCALMLLPINTTATRTAERHISPGARRAFQACGEAGKSISRSLHPLLMHYGSFDRITPQGQDTLSISHHSFSPAGSISE
jgi:hypothetical protein